MQRLATKHELITAGNRCLYSCNSNNGKRQLSRFANQGDDLAAKLEALRSVVTKNPEKTISKKKVKERLGFETSWVQKHRRRRDDDEELKPHKVSIAVKALAEQQELDKAIEYVSNLPSAALNTPVWNTLISEVYKARKFNLAWQLYNTVRLSLHLFKLFNIRSDEKAWF